MGVRAGYCLGLAIASMVACGSGNASDPEPAGQGGGAGTMAHAGGSSGQTGGQGGVGGASAHDAGPPPPPVTTGDVFGPVHTGSYNDGPVDYAESAYHNACAPAEKYPASIQQLYGPYLGGVDNSLGADGSLCDACALVTTRLGKKVLIRLVTYGVSKAPGDLDLSPEAYNAIYQMDPMGTPDVPRPMSWQLARCPTTDNIDLEFQTKANPYWTSFWVRNAALPIKQVESKADGESSYTVLDRTSDGPFTDGNGVGMGAFEVRITSVDDQVVQETFNGFTAGSIVTTTMQFK